jgi:uncharacterized RDD family membrane protein YckC
MSSTIPVSAAGAGAVAGSVVAVDQLAGRGTRLLAKIIDSIIMGVLWIPFMLGGGLAAVMSSGLEEGSDPTGLIVTLLGSMSISGLLTLIFVVVQIYLLSKDGQTVGKKLTKIRIVKLETGQNGGFMPNVILRALVPVIINSFTGIFSLVDALFIFREDRRCIHDMLAGTTVVRAA